MTAGKSRWEKKIEKKRNGGDVIGSDEVRLVSDRQKGFSSLLMKMFHSHLMPPSLMNSIEEKRETDREENKFSFCQIG